MEAKPKKERALIHSYNFERRKFEKVTAELAIDAKPFQEGAFRYAFKAKLFLNGEQQAFVVKQAKDDNTPRQLYFHDIEAQVYAHKWAKAYNALDPPKKITFILCFVVEMVDRPGRPVLGCESEIPGVFRKRNNNVGAMCTYQDEDDTDGMLYAETAQAFSHFTYHHSGHKILICDIQGVNGSYTDPQVHTITGIGFGSGNLGQTGIRAFLLRHKCNSICKHLGLPALDPAELKDVPQAGGPAKQIIPDLSALNLPDPTKLGMVEAPAPKVRRTKTGAVVPASRSPNNYSRASTSALSPKAGGAPESPKAAAPAPASAPVPVPVPVPAAAPARSPVPKLDRSLSPPTDSKEEGLTGRRLDNSDEALMDEIAGLL